MCGLGLTLHGRQKEILLQLYMYVCWLWPAPACCQAAPIKALGLRPAIKPRPDYSAHMRMYSIGQSEKVSNVGVSSTVTYGFTDVRHYELFTVFYEYRCKSDILEKRAGPLKTCHCAVCTPKYRKIGCLLFES